MIFVVDLEEVRLGDQAQKERASRAKVVKNHWRKYLRCWFGSYSNNGKLVYISAYTHGSAHTVEDLFILEANPPPAHWSDEFNSQLLVLYCVVSDIGELPWPSTYISVSMSLCVCFLESGGAESNPWASILP